jgi:hypothetical protein
MEPKIECSSSLRILIITLIIIVMVIPPALIASKKVYVDSGENIKIHKTELTLAD